MSSRCPLVELTPELKLTIIDFLDLAGRIQLSTTCRTFRTVLVPSIFETVVLKNNDGSVQTLSTFLDGPYTSHVKIVHFKGYAKAPEWVDMGENYDADDQADIDAVLPSKIEQIFDSMSCLTNLERLVVETPVWDEQEITGAFYSFDLNESDDDVTEDETIHGWRQLMKRTYELVTKIPDGQIRHLEIRGHVPKLISSWRYPTFQKLLNGLNSFSLHLRGCENGAGWTLATAEGFVTTTERYGLYLFDHLHNIERLEIRNSDEAPIGYKSSSDRWFAQLMINPSTMPKLRHLHLEYIFVCPELRDLICHQAVIIESITLINSAALCDEDEVVTCLPWSEFLNAVADAKPTRLRSFQIMTQPNDESKRKPSDKTTCKDHLLYYCWDTKYGSMPVDYYQRAGDADTNGADGDQRLRDDTAFDRLMALVEANRKTVDP